MKWSRKLTITAVASSLLIIATGCPPDVDPAEVTSFDADPQAITSGTTFDDEEVQGTSTLTWQLRNAESAQLYADGDAIDMDGCEPVEDSGDDCLPAGQIEVEPRADTTYELELTYEDGTVSDTVDVEVLAPASMTLDPGVSDRFAPGEEFTVDYSVDDARDFAFGIRENGSFEPCAIDDDSAQCSRPDADSGQLTLRDIDEPIELTGWADNGAEDGLGDIQIGDVSIDLLPTGAADITAFGADPTHVAFGETSDLSWETEEADRIEIESDAEELGLVTTDLDECADEHGDGGGTCTVEFAEEGAADPGSALFTLTAFNESDEASEPATTTVVVGAAPSIDQFTVDPEELPEEGGDVELSWVIENEPEHLEITADDDVVLDSDDEDVDLSEDSFEITDIEQNTQFTLTASSLLGSDSASVNVRVAGAPWIEVIDVEGTDVLEDPAVVDMDTADMEWETDETESTELFRGDVPEDGCDSPDADLTEVGDFPGDADGNYELTGLDQIDECFELVATGDADQSASETFLVARAPEAHSFDASPGDVTTGSNVELSWSTSFATEVVVDADPGAAVRDEDLEGCSEVDEDGDGTCTVEIRSGAPHGDVEFSLEAVGFDDLQSDALTDTISVGAAPTIDSFANDPVTADEGDDVTLSWETGEADELVITDADGVVFEEDSDEGIIDDGSHEVVDIQQTTTWTLEVSNDFGSTTSSATTFLGPAITQFDVNTEDALDGSATVATGDVDFEWDSDFSEDTELYRAEVPAGDGNTCGEVDDWGDPVADADSDGSYSEELVQNWCYRLTAIDGQDQTSSLDVLVEEVPFETNIETNVDSVSGDDGGDVTVSLSVVGVTQFDLVAIYYDEDDEFLGESSVCDEDEATGGGSLDGSADEHDVHCDHEMDGQVDGLGGCGGFGQPSCEPRPDTDYIRYELQYADDENDGDTADSGEYDADVDVEWD